MGKAFVFGDNISTDAIAPGLYLRAEPDVMASLCLESVDPSFVNAVKAGDILVAGKNFGMGSARGQAALSLKLLGVRAILVHSAARIFYRNAFNYGVPVLRWEYSDTVTTGDDLDVDLAAGRVENLSTGTSHAVEALPAHLMTLIHDGGLTPWP